MQRLGEDYSRVVLLVVQVSIASEILHNGGYVNAERAFRHWQVDGRRESGLLLQAGKQT